MPGVMIYAAGYVTNDLTYRQSARDERHDFLSFTMAHNNGYIDDNGVWQQTSTLWLNVKAFGALARNARGVIAKGRPVMVHGELKHETFDGADGHKHSSLDLKADGIGLNLRLCGAMYTGPGERTREAAPAAGVAQSGAPDSESTEREGESGAGTASTSDGSVGEQAPALAVVPDF
ncbi:Single-strand binding protein/Primosomal replication protein n OS=Tsukamurella paurometabola (strain ATCC 8368 / DSM / CCUG 35730 / CIP 100753 / JCM 10117/ KCTC 9821 / NBRC 16120 / NCIMB 702349 / NCTC 13040) OX=521096 GN=Tpau_1374 PE=4 SV=1 [Tsukamurella paurometabola]|uniref:Single-strand binding protein/Primosomal replication protein n n=1 Tax=Tsukamurella paurometabola (strain ATCC 8368 / DSM 20162 / CCUG 35730 / CIP 100753 / JCM 10117 / KCTC 9821 / NBRC 16120 / NCIMB 702349 / NCTC 13040) TaxID=521096 RepID=D5UWY0_TSUPD|nr:single-stranded DNA-binding protein [Tsukamurella paurometabola]ADG78002.1 single-strand binding protein/Primosomal replication protein n [Tsukamurella paurometabola DSM 20162]SUP29735.1 single-stranded DNA-binding protein [Tsukamurella paurometabola]